MIRRAGLLVVLGAVLCLAVAPSAAPAKSNRLHCHASTKLGKHEHVLLFRVHCNFEVDSINVKPSSPAIVRWVKRHPRLRRGEEQDHFSCKRDANTADCSGRAGHEVTVVGALRMDGDRCDTATRFAILGGMDCEDGAPGTSCPAIGYFANIRDPHPSGCG